MGDVQVIEGAWPGSVVLMEFPTMADAGPGQSPFHQPRRINGD